MKRLPSRLARIVLPVVLLGACSAGRFAEVANLNDPRTIVDESINGGQLTLRQGAALVVRLPVQAGDDYHWELKPPAATTLATPIQIDYMPAAGIGTLPIVPAYSGWLSSLNPPGSERIPVVVDASKPAPYITQGEAVLRVRGVSPGTATVQLDYRPVAQPAAAAAKTVRFDVAVVQ
jgi:predicted secreted protein